MIRKGILLRKTSSQITQRLVQKAKLTLVSRMKQRKMEHEINGLKAELSGSLEKQSKMSLKTAELAKEISALILNAERLQTENWNLLLEVSELKKKLEKAAMVSVGLEANVKALNQMNLDISEDKRNIEIARHEKDAEITSLSAQLESRAHSSRAEREQRRHLEKRVNFLTSQLALARVTIDSIETDIRMSTVKQEEF